MGRRQPAVEGEHTRLHPEAQQHQKGRQQQKALLSGQLLRVQHPTGSKVQGGAVGVEDKQAKEHTVGPAQGVKQVFQPRQHRFPFPVVEDQGEGEQGHHLIEQVEGGQIAREAQAYQHPVDRQNKAEKPPGGRLMLHVRPGIDGGQQPHQGNQHHQHPPRPVRAQGQDKLRGQMQQHQLSADQKSAHQGRPARGRQRKQAVKCDGAPVVHRPQQEQKPGQQREQGGQQ